MSKKLSCFQAGNININLVGGDLCHRFFFDVQVPTVPGHERSPNADIVRLQQSFALDLIMLTDLHRS